MATPRRRGFCVFCKDSIYEGQDAVVVVFEGPAPCVCHRRCAEDAGAVRRPQKRGPTGQFVKRPMTGSTT